MGWLVQATDWRQAMWLIAFIGFALAALGWAFVRDKAPESLEREILHSHGDERRIIPQDGVWTCVIEVVRKPQSWLIALYGFFMYVTLSGFADQWGPHFLMSVYNLDKATAGGVNSAMYIGIGIGSPLFPLLCQKLKAYKPAVFISAFGAMLFLSAIFFLPVLPLWLLISLLFLAGFFLGGQFLGFSMTCALNPLSASATAGGFHNMICMLSGVIFQPFIGYLLKQSWNGEFVNGIPVYTSSNYVVALSSISISLLLACLIVLPIEEK